MSRGASEARAGFVVPEAGKIRRGVIVSSVVGSDDDDDVDDGEKGDEGEEGSHNIIVVGRRSALEL